MSPPHEESRPGGSATETARKSNAKDCKQASEPQFSSRHERWLDDNWEQRCRGEVNEYLDAIFGPEYYPDSYAVIAVSCGPYLTDSGKVRWRERAEEYFAWPEQREKLVDTVLAYAPEADISICPNLMRAKRRAKGNSVARKSLHADVDSGFNKHQQDRVRELPGGCAVDSGTPGHAHVYVRLDESLTVEQHGHLCRALGEWFHADDHKISDNDLMRLPGTWNFKPRAYDPDADPLPVTWAVPPVRRAAVNGLCQHMGVSKNPSVLRAVGTGTGHDASREPVDLTKRQFRKVREALSEDTGDRSEDTMRIVGVCAARLMTLPQVRWVVDQRADLQERLSERSDDDVARCWQKVTAERQAADGVRDVDDEVEPVHHSGQAALNGGGVSHRRRVQLIRATDIYDGVPEWAWEYRGEGRIQRSVPTLFGGRPGAGKSTAARFFAAEYSRGAVDGCWHGQPQRIAYIAAEEPLDLVVKPSLRAHGAEMDMIFFPQVSVVENGHDKHAKLLSTEDEDELTRLFVEHGITVVVVDPVMATIKGAADVYRNNEVREYMEPWSRIAERINGVVIAIVHLKKVTTGDVVAAITGSSAFGEVARCVFGFAKDPASDDDERVMSQAKNSCGVEDLSLNYTIRRTTVSTDSGKTAPMGIFTITGDSDTTVAEILSNQRRHSGLTQQMQMLLAYVDSRAATTPRDLVEGGYAVNNKQASQKLRRLLDKGLITQVARGEYGSLSCAGTGEESEETEETEESAAQRN